MTNLETILADLSPERKLAIEHRTHQLVKEFVHVFLINGKEWWAGTAPSQVLEQYASDYGLPESEVFAATAIELSEGQLDAHRFSDPDQPDEQPVTFRQRLDRMIEGNNTFPCFFASREI